MRSISIIALSLLLAACGSTRSGDDDFSPSTSSSGRTEIEIVQLTSMAGAARHTSGGMPVQYRMRVTNRGDQPITLRRVTLQSIGLGAYSIPNASRPFNVAIEPAQHADVEFWVPTTIQDSVAGANGPVTLRAVAVFDSPTGKFQDIVTAQVSGMQAGGLVQ
jgi:hypothetical protein